MVKIGQDWAISNGKGRKKYVNEEWNTDVPWLITKILCILLKILFICLLICFIASSDNLIRDTASHGQPYLVLDQGIVNTHMGSCILEDLHSGLLKIAKNLLWRLSGGLVQKDDIELFLPKQKTSAWLFLPAGVLW